MQKIAPLRNHIDCVANYFGDGFSCLLLLSTPLFVQQLPLSKIKQIIKAPHMRPFVTVIDRALVFPRVIIRIECPFHDITCVSYGPLARYVKLGLRMRRECRELFPRHRGFCNPDMHHGTCVTHVPWCIPGSLTIGFSWSRWRGKHSWHSRRMRNPQFYVSGKRSMEVSQSCTKQMISGNTKISCFLHKGEIELNLWNAVFTHMNIIIFLIHIITSTDVWHFDKDVNELWHISYNNRL